MLARLSRALLLALLYWVAALALGELVDSQLVLWLSGAVIGFIIGLYIIIMLFNGKK